MPTLTICLSLWIASGLIARRIALWVRVWTETNWSWFEQTPIQKDSLEGVADVGDWPFTHSMLAWVALGPLLLLCIGHLAFLLKSAEAWHDDQIAEEQHATD